MQLVGHLRDRALQEWSLLRTAERETLDAAVGAMRTRLDTSCRTVAAQDFYHAAQREGESVSSYISRLEQLFR